ncbi:hypothetical protein [Treponema denticola]|uniref:hypothetical protein n=1 Tax=Treponema denticola TaxID=158 RepID=UPI00210715AE|nr:hypothetical protein [Treponema denticola]UTY24779.1 hypothetical protein E4N78_12085 [Treponema denticola]
MIRRKSTNNKNVDFRISDCPWSFRGVLVMGLIMISIISCTEKSKYIGTWIHTYDGSDSRPYVDWSNNFAENELVLYDDGTFAYNWVATYSTNDFIGMPGNDLRLAYRVSDWANAEGDWHVENDELTLEYTAGKKAGKVETLKIEIDDKGKTLKIKDWTYRKKRH